MSPTLENPCTRLSDPGEPTSAAKPEALDAKDVARWIEAHQVEAEVVHLATHTPTVELAAQAVGTDPERIVKSLLFLVEGRPVVVVACGVGRVDQRAIASWFGVGRKRVRLASPAEVLAATGYPIGALPPFGHRQPLPTLIDRRALIHPEVYAGGGSIDALVRLNPADIQRLTEAGVADLVQPTEAKDAPDSQR
jgi:Cys-tRNA(Pro) deacylase